MTTRKEREKLQNERFLQILAGLLKDDDNKYCVDCDSKGPRWASWNLGIFLCIRCAGIHRNLGVHISKVKSVNLDTWTAQQVAMMKEIGNSRGRAVYEANLPDSFRRPQTDSALEQFIRAKYEQKRYIAKEWIPPTPKVDDILRETTPTTNKRVTKVAGHGRQQSDGGPVSATSLPRPEGAPRHNRLAPIQASTQHAQSSPSVDLLGLDAAPALAPSEPSGHHRAASADDLFGDFLSSPPLPQSTDHQPQQQHQQQQQQQAHVQTSVSSDLFGLNFGHPSVPQNQPPQAANDAVHSTGTSSTGDQSSTQAKSKESILALYGSMPSMPSVQQPQYYYTGSSQQTNVSAFGCGGSGNMNFSMQSQTQPLQSWPGMAAYTTPQTTGLFGPQHNPFLGGPVSASGGPPAVNPQQNQQAYLQQIQQKLSGLHLNGSPAGGPTGWDERTSASGPAPSGQTMATNLWQ